jgi:hypothetical protein
MAVRPSLIASSNRSPKDWNLGVRKWVEMGYYQGWHRGRMVGKNGREVGIDFLLFGHPCCVLKCQLCTTNLLLAQINMLPELSNSIQRCVVLEA